MAGVWIVGQVKLNCEKLAARNIAQQNFALYMPYTAEVINNPRSDKGKLVVGRPLFRGYIFIDIEDRRWQLLLSTQGLYGLIGVGSSAVVASRPSVLPDGTIEKLRAREDNSGLIKLPPPRQFQKGESVRISEGSFRGQQGICQGMDHKERARILLDYLGRKTHVLIAKELVEAV